MEPRPPLWRRFRAPDWRPGEAIADAWRRLRWRAVMRWARRHGWSLTPVRDDWPWQRYSRSGLPAVVGLAISGTVDGFPVTVADIGWRNRFSLPGLVRGLNGRGVAVVVRLPREYPDSGVWRDVFGRRRSTGAAFDRAYRIVCTDRDFVVERLGPPVRSAHAAGDMPPWMLIGGELYTVLPWRALWPGRAAPLARTVLRVADLLGIGTPAGDPGTEPEGPVAAPSGPPPARAEPDLADAA